MDDKTVRVEDEIVQKAKSLVFVDHGDGGPTIILSRDGRSKWFGVCNEAGKAVYGEEDTHYDLACDEEGVFSFEGEDAFVLQEEGPTAFVGDTDGFRLIRWVGADSPAAVLAVAEACSYVPCVEDGAAVYFTSPGGQFTLMHATDDGRTLATSALWTYHEFEIPAGRYAVHRLDVEGSSEWSGMVEFPDGSEEAMVRAFRFVREPS